MTTKNLPSFSSDLKGPPVGIPAKSVPQSPIDMLPKGKPLPEAFFLQKEVDMKQQKESKGHEYINVDQKTEEMMSVFKSDPSKLEKIEKFDLENVSKPEVEQKMRLNQFRRSPVPLENSEKISSRLNDDNIYEKAKQIPGSENQSENPNIPVMSSEVGKEASNNPKDNSQCPGFDIDFSKELDEIETKAAKVKSSMNRGIFDKFHPAGPR
ncbi:uncharacterized protein LOC132721773 [Ruditapes philippinarum]|uniref:uncharacterized protein LOC132721773 n=1 Tax=Ruditapes philippinarum TaxID=129788 RepID=UPI00295B88FB|nr:uncharacterized protein LOC132721773 [Ruditapes philippinarum]